MLTVAFLLFDDCEVLDFTGPFDVFSMSNIASRNHGLASDDLYKLITISRDGALVTALHGLKIMPDYSIESCPRIDILIVPGGTGTVIDGVLAGKYDDLIGWIAGVAPKTKITASVCVGAFFPAKAGLFVGGNATTHHGFLDKLQLVLNDHGGTLMRGPRYVVNAATGPQIMSSAGVSAGIDLAFYIIEHCNGLAADLGPAVRRATENLMEYNGTTNWTAA